MYKTKLQELCQRNSWNLPEYETSRDGPSHNARFSTTVTVNERPFRSTSPSRTSKQSQNSAAMLAFNHFSQQIPNPVCTPFPSNFPSFPQPSLSSSPGSSGHSPDLGYIDQPNHNGRNQERMLHVYKNQLQCYAHKRNLNLPTYSSEWEGPPHATQFKSKVTIDGQTFESPKFFLTLKDAEHAAAEIALMTLSPNGLQEDSGGLFKNLLQEVVQKEGYCLPLYSTQISGEAHMPIFVSTVEVDGEHFTGQEAKSKKQAETNAAKVAYTTLKERKAHQAQAPEFPPYCSEENVITGLQHPSNKKSPVNPGLVGGNQSNKDKGESDQSSLFPLSANHGQGAYLTSDHHSKLNVGTDLQPNSDPKSLVSHGLVAHDQPNKDKVEKGSSSVGSGNGVSENFSLSDSKPFPSSSHSKNIASETSDMSSTAVSAPSGKKKLIVYSRKTNVEIEEGGTLLPFSDDMWAAYVYS